MTGASWDRVIELLERAGDLAGDERARLLDAECADDPDLRRRVEVLLDADARAQSFLAPPRRRPLEPGAPAIRFGQLRAGDVVGRYTIVRAIGSGGMGSVYEATQDLPRRSVALKMFDPGVASSSAIARFRFEAELLARLEHPAIAVVHEAGEDGEGGAYLALELVEDARHVTDHVIQARLGEPAVIALFLEICAAVAHAHEHGVIHRDLKSSNVLVGPSGRPKVIDFGVARSLDPGSTRLTREGEVVGTLVTMSPEQVAGRPEDVDVRSDVYALGALLYEMLAGRGPRDLSGLTLTEALKIVREGRTEPLRLHAPGVSPDLGWITAKALEADPTRRYASVAELMLDLQRLQRHEPVRASPPTTSYRAAKFVRRHRFGVAVSVTFAVLFLIAVGTAMVAEVHAKGLAERAVRAERQTLERAESIAVALEQNREILALQASWLDTDAFGEEGRQVRVADVLDAAARTLDERQGTSAPVEAELRHALVNAYSSLLLWGQVCEQAESLRPIAGALDADRRDRVERMWAGAAAQSQRMPEARAAADAGYAAATARYGPDDPRTIAWRVRRAEIASRADEHEDAESELRACIAQFDAMSEPPAETVFEARIWLVRVLRSLGRRDAAVDEAERLVQSAIALFGADHSNVHQARESLAAVQSLNHEYDAAIASYEALMADYERRYGPDSSAALGAASDLAWVLRDARRELPRAEALSRRAAEGAIAAHGLRHKASETRLARWGSVLNALGRSEEGLEKLELALAARRERVGPDHVSTLELGGTVAAQLYGLRRTQDALVMATDVYRRCLIHLGHDHTRTLSVANTLAVVRQSIGDVVGAVDLLAFISAQRDRLQGRFEHESVLVLENLSLLVQRAGDAEEARCWHEDLVARQIARAGPRSLRAWRGADRLAQIRDEAGEHESARLLATQILESLAEAPKSDHRRTVLMLLIRGHASQALGDNHGATADRAEALRISWSMLPVDDPIRVDAEAVANDLAGGR